jgi:hypothetical protein
MVSQIEGDKLCILLSKGSFSLSEECEKEYRKRAGNDANVQERLLIPFRFDPDTPPGPVNIRIDPVLFAIYREKGSQWCSGGKLFLACVPAYFSEYFDISLEENVEIISIDIQKLLEITIEIFLSSTKELKKTTAADTLDLVWGSECALQSVCDDLREAKQDLLKKIQYLDNNCAYIRKEEQKLVEYAEYAKVLEEKWNVARSLSVKSLADLGSKTLDDGWSLVKKRVTAKVKKELNPIVPCKPSINRFSYLYDDN